MEKVLGREVGEWSASNVAKIFARVAARFSPRVSKHITLAVQGTASHSYQVMYGFESSTPWQHNCPETAAANLNDNHRVNCRPHRELSSGPGR